MNKYFRRLLDAMRSTAKDEAMIAQIAYRINGARATYTLGNGGSAAMADHFASDLVRIGHQAFSLSCNMSLISAFGNDLRFEDIFAQQIMTTGISHRDVVVAFSGSGCSPNVISGVTQAQVQQAFTIGITGSGDPNWLKEHVDLPVVLPTSKQDHIEDLHLALCHAVVSMMLDPDAMMGIEGGRVYGCPE